MTLHKGGITPNYYQLLEVNVGADEEEIRRAYERIKQVYAEDSLATYGLYSQDDLKEFRNRIEQAFRILVDPENRREYDQKLFAEPVKKRKQRQFKVRVRLEEQGPGGEGETLAQEAGEYSEPAVAESWVPVEEEEEEEPAARPITLRKPVSVPPDAVFSGELLQKLREEAGVSLHVVSETTKVSIYNLRLLEAEDWKRLPALVYIKGFISNYARYLGIDEKRVQSDMMDRYRKATDPEKW